jgi:phospholipase C
VTLSRRTLLGAAGATGAAGALALAGASRLIGDPAVSAISTLPAPSASGIEHIVVVMMENRSFDHFLGWLPGADGKQSGLRFQDRYGAWHATHHMTSFNTCGFNDPDHSYEGGRIQLNGGRCDGWLKAGLSDVASIGYYQKPDLAFFGPAASLWTTFDRYFSAVMAETYPNRFYQHAAQTPQLHNTMEMVDVPTIWDRLAAKGVSGTYYFGDVPFVALWGQKYVSIAKPFETFLVDAASGTLPAVSFVDPRFTDEASGTSNDDHPHADIRSGEVFLNQVYDAVRTGPGWANTALIINFDEWGGFFDHVKPSTAPDVSPVTSLRGFRVPALMISPRARRGHVAHNVYDHTSILKMIEWRWGLAPLTVRDKYARNMAEVLDFSKPPNLASPTFLVPPFTTLGCNAGEGVSVPADESATEMDPEFAEWGGLKEFALAHGWELPA